MDIVGHRKIFFIISGALFLMSVAVISVLGLRLGIDFTGGSILEVEFRGVRPDVTLLQEEAAESGLGNVLFTPAGEKGLFVRTGYLSEESHQKLLAIIGSYAGEAEGTFPEEAGFVEKQFDSIGPTIGRELRNRSIQALVLVVLLIVIYVAWAFRKVSRPISSWKYGVVAIFALLHDVTIPTGIFAFLGHFSGIEVDTLFVTALLTILGFSVHDTIVVFDRIRENLKDQKSKETFEETINRSLNETIVRSINTSMTVLLSLLMVFFFGGESVKFFSLALIIGVLFGTYSSIFIASPLLVSWYHILQKKRAV